MMKTKSPESPPRLRRWLCCGKVPTHVALWHDNARVRCGRMPSGKANELCYSCAMTCSTSPMRAVIALPSSVRA